MTTPSDNLLAFPREQAIYRRPLQTGMLPGRLFRVPPSRKLAEETLGLKERELLSGQSVYPSGLWQYHAAQRVVTWSGAKAHCHPPVSSPPATVVPLQEAVIALAHSRMVLTEGHMLRSSGWTGKPSTGEAIMRHLAADHGDPINGISGVVKGSRITGSDWEFEMYRNGMIWADSAEHLEVLLEVLVFCVRGDGPLTLLQST